MARTGTYPVRKVKLTAENIKHLLSGKGTRIDPHQIDAKDGHRMYVHPAQAHWLNRGKKAGLPIHFPPMNRRSMMQNLAGGSVFSDFVDTLKEKTDPTRQKAAASAQDYGVKGVDALVAKLKQIGTDKGLPKITAAVIDKVGKPLLDKLVKAGIGKITKAVIGHGLGKNGCGFAKCRGNACKRAVATTTQRLYPANQKPI